MRNIHILIDIFRYEIYHEHSLDETIEFLVKLNDKAFANYFNNSGSFDTIELHYDFLMSKSQIDHLKILGTNKMKILYYICNTTQNMYVDSKYVDKYKINLDMKDLAYIDTLLPNNSSTFELYSMFSKNKKLNYNGLQM